MGTSYGEVAKLEQEFDKQCEDLGIRWIDEEVRLECLCDFITQYEDGNYQPEVMFCNYGYEKVKMSKIYLITNPEFHSKKVVAENMEQALVKYRKYVETTLSYDYSPEAIMRGITDCSYIEDFNEEDILL